MNRTRVPRALAMTLAVLAAGACASLPAPLAPVQRPVLSALEVDQSIVRDGLRVEDFTPDGLVILPDNSRLEGRAAVAEWLLDPAGAGYRAFDLFPATTHRCAVDVGIALGTFKATHRSSGGLAPAAGRWAMHWRLGPDGAWRVEEVHFLRPGAEAVIPDGCIAVEEEVRANSRFWFTAHIPPFEYRTADPHAGTESLGRYPYLQQHTSRWGGQAAAFYRLGSWHGVGGRVLVEPGRVTEYYRAHSPWLHSARENLTSSSAMLALVTGYEGRNVAVDAGPGLVRSRWAWGPHDADETTAVRHGLGAVVSMHATIPLTDGAGLNLLVQRRWLGKDAIPRTEGPHRTSADGWYLGLGLAARSGR